MTKRLLRVSVGAGEDSVFPSALLGGGRTQLGAPGIPEPGCVADLQLRLMSWKPAY